MARRPPEYGVRFVDRAGPPGAPQKGAKNSAPPDPVSLTSWDPMAHANVFDGCTPEQGKKIDASLMLARSRVRVVLADLGVMLQSASSKSGNSNVDGAVLKFFKHTKKWRVRQIINRLGAVQRALARSTKNWRCFTNEQCLNPQVCTQSPDRVVPLACASPQPPVRLCPPFFDQSMTEGAQTLIHEAAHQAGFALGRHAEVYAHDPRFPGLSGEFALVNPDSLAQFVFEARYGPPVAPTHGPHRRVSWKENMGFVLQYEIPGGKRKRGFRRGLMRRFDAGEGDIQNRLKGYFKFYVDDVGSPRPAGFPMPTIWARISLQRFEDTGKNYPIVRLWQFRDENPTYVRSWGDPVDAKGEIVGQTEGGHALVSRSREAQRFDLRFRRQDKGALLFEANLEDPETGKQHKFVDAVGVYPAGTKRRNVPPRPAPSPYPIQFW